MKKTKAKAAKAAKAAAASEVKVTAEIKDETDSSSSKSERVSKEETDSTREMLKTIVASLNEADAAKLLRRANLLEQASDQSAIELGEARRQRSLDQCNADFGLAVLFIYSDEITYLKLTWSHTKAIFQ